MLPIPTELQQPGPMVWCHNNAYMLTLATERSCPRACPETLLQSFRSAPPPASAGAYAKTSGIGSEATALAWRG